MINIDNFDKNVGIYHIGIHHKIKKMMIMKTFAV